MATDDSFRDVDWDSMGGAGLTPRETAMLVFGGVFLALLAFDFLVLHDGLNWVSGLVEGPQFQWVTEQEGAPLPFGVDLSTSDWLLVLTLAVMLFYGVWPLYDNPRLAAYYWRRFRQNKAAMASAVYLLVIFAVGMVGPAFIDQPELAFDQVSQPPIYTSTPMSTTGGACVGDTVTKTVTTNGQAVPTTFCQGSWAHPLGTTNEGKDLVDLLVLGMRVSMKVSLITMLLVISIGSLVGTTAAYYGGYVDEVLMRYVDIQGTFPSFFLFLILAYLFTPTLGLLIALFGLLGWEGTSRLVRSEALQRTEEEYVQAAENAGASDGWIIRRHILPNVSTTVITNATLLIPSFILLEAALAFLGLTDPSVASWGKTISAGRDYLSSAWWIATLPGVFLFFTILAFNMVGDGLRDALDPRSGGRS
ncbi:ABC transporter permease [Salinirubellus salinus]|uniref:ABC transporter permease n=1 Tax=Salinirubellus salinus TaxID=1364945 RepID=A0A9E7R0V6_9EURY|nr:ABC transporter permease [Salinirubellus salinus]UWM53577.1 ABC transporter permease [Salinirubellus salinus]